MSISIEYKTLGYPMMFYGVLVGMCSKCFLSFMCEASRSAHVSSRMTKWPRAPRGMHCHQWPCLYDVCTSVMGEGALMICHGKRLYDWYIWWVVRVVV